jgi:phosphoribosylglycinamide formyltransferase 1
MSVRPVRFGILASTGGSVLGRMFESAWFRERVSIVVTDRPCGALARAANAGVPGLQVVLSEPVAREKALADAFTAAGVDHVLLFYTRLLRHELLRRFRGRLWNLHPSLLPAFPGAHPFEDAILADARVLGTTIHAVDEGMDTGPVLLQSAFARRPGDTEAQLRHALFEQQVRGGLQACHWLAAGRVRVDGNRVTLRDEPEPAMLDQVLFTPGLEDVEARTIRVPAPLVTGGSR